MSFYVYILQSDKDQSFYFGQTRDLAERLRRHNRGLEKYTRKRAPWKLFWKAEVPSRAEAMRLEKKLKNLKSTKRMVEFVRTWEVGPAA